MWGKHERECLQMTFIRFTGCLLALRDNASGDENVEMMSSLRIVLFVGYPYTRTPLQEDHHALSARTHPSSRPFAYTLKHNSRRRSAAR